MSDAQLLHEMAKGLAEVKGISEDQAIKLIRGEYTLNSELHLKIPQTQTPTYQPPQNTSFEATRDLIAKGSARSEAAQAGSQASALEMRKLELEERRLDSDQRRYDAEQRREDAAAQERKDNQTMQQERLAFEREQARMTQDLRRDEMKLDRETTRVDQKFTQMLAMSQMSGKGSDEMMKMLENQNNAQRDYFKEINTVKDNERQHTDQLRTDLAKIESDRDVELAKLKSSSDQNTATAIDELVSKMDDNFQGLIKPSDNDEDFLEKYNKQIEKVNTFQKNLTAAGLNTLKSQGVDVEALKKAHNIATDSEESTLDKIIGVGKDLYEKTIKPGMEEAAKNGSGTGTNAPSGLETAFETPDNEMEARIRAEQEARDRNNQLAMQEEQVRLEQENVALKNEVEQYEKELYNKALQYNIPTHGLSLEELESKITQYETIINTQFNSAPQTKSIKGLGQMAHELKINPSGKTVGQVESEVIQAQQKIEQELDSLPDHIPDPEPELIPSPVQADPIIEPDPKQETQQIPVPMDTQDLKPTPYQEPPKTQEDTHIHEETDNTTPDDKTSNHQKRSITAQHSTDVKKINKKKMKKFTQPNGIVVEGRTPHTAAMKLAKELGGTSESPALVELTDESGAIYKYETRLDDSKIGGGKTKVPRAKLINRK